MLRKISLVAFLTSMQGIAMAQTADCISASVSDDNGTASGSSIQINYLDPRPGVDGEGGSITFNAESSAPATSMRIVGDDGSDSTTVVGLAPPRSSWVQSESSDVTGTPALDPSSVTYEITFDDGGGPGTSCTVTVTWAQTTAMLEGITSVGGNVTISATLRNARWDGNKFGDILTPSGERVDLVTPSSAFGNQMTFTDALVIESPGAADVGDYLVSTVGPGIDNTASDTYRLEAVPEIADNNDTAVLVWLITRSSDLEDEAQ